MQQEKLFHDTLSDALRDVVQSAGGPKHVAGELWPSKQPAAAARQLNQCLDDDRPEKLSLDEVVHVLQLGRANGCHVAMHFLAEALGYEKPKTVNPESERDRLQREFIKATQTMQQLSAQMQRLSPT